jgi:HlyD family secretion protein
MVKGYVSSISEVPDDNYYTVEVDLPKGLKTYYDKDIPFSQNMQGKAEILTDPRRLLHRVLDPVRSSITKQIEM